MEMLVQTWHKTILVRRVHLLQINFTADHIHITAYRMLQVSLYCKTHLPNWERRFLGTLCQI
jgi:hypothetical protein